MDVDDHLYHIVAVIPAEAEVVGVANQVAAWGAVTVGTAIRTSLVDVLRACIHAPLDNATVVGSLGIGCKTARSNHVSTVSTMDKIADSIGLSLSLLMGILWDVLHRYP